MEGTLCSRSLAVARHTETSIQVLRKALQTALGPGPSKQLRQFQEYESRVLMYDLMHHGDRSAVQESGAQDPHDVIMQGHWYALVRRYVSILARRSFLLLSALIPLQATSVTLYALYGKRVNRFVDNPDL